MKRVVVTGAAGFVGRAVCRSLVAAGYEVSGVYHRSTPAQPIGGMTWVQGEGLGRNADWRGLFRGADYVVHAAAIAHRLDRNAPVSEEVYNEVNHLGTRQIVESSRDVGVKRVIYLSSIGAVLDASDILVDESTPSAPATPYGRSKRDGERALATALQGSATDWCILRPTLVYGQGNPGNMARLQKLVRSGFPIPLGAVQNRRSFLYLENLVSAIERVLESPGAARESFCVADDQILSTRELIAEIARACGASARLWSASPRTLARIGKTGDWLQRTIGRSPGFDSNTIRKLTGSLPVSNQRLRERCGWRAPFSVSEGLLATFDRRNAGRV